MAWRPLFDRLKKEHSGDVLHEGVPDWLWSGFFTWVEARFRSASGYLQSDMLQAVEQQMRTSLDWRHGADSAWRSFRERMFNDHDLALEVANFLLVPVNREYKRYEIAGDLEAMLSLSGSAWRVAEDDGFLRLERRVPEEVRDRYRDVAQQGRHGEHLRAAWAAMYGRNPDASSAYRHAVSAVEAAGASVISPRNVRTTLGTMIRDFAAKPDKWDVPLGSTPEQGREVFLDMMRGVWHGQKDRHGTPDETRPISVSPREAEAALHTALTLVHLFQSGLVSNSGR